MCAEHSNALSLSAKKIISLEQAIKAYKFTAKDVAKCLGDCLHGGASLPVTKEELEDMYKAVSSASQTAADATLALRLAERVASLFAVLDNELQQALVDVPPTLREQIRQIPGFEQALVEHKRGASQVTGDLQRLLSSVEEATLHFDLELTSVQVSCHEQANPSVRSPLRPTVTCALIRRFVAPAGGRRPPTRSRRR